MKEQVVEARLIHSFDQFKDRSAIEWRDQVLTYGELDRLTDVIARQIIGRGVSPGTMIGVFLNHRRDFILAMIGIFKAGCGFVPLDTALPVSRIRTMIAVTDLHWIITDEEGRGHLDSREFGKHRWPEILHFRELSSPPIDTAGPQASAVYYRPDGKIYIYFTSGTTGQPKAVVGRNRSLLHFIDWEIDTFGIDETYRFSQLTTTGFDVFLRDILVPLCAGAAICIPDRPETLLSGESLTRWTDNRHITLVHCVPSLFRQLNSDTLRKEHFRSLRYILLAGERIVPAELRSWYETMGARIQLVNLYGPTETTLAKLYYMIRESDVDRKTMPVGKPIPGARVVVLDEDMEVCDHSVVGEVYIRTPFRSFGYLNEPGLNREKFIPNPFGRDPRDLIYKTGDLGRILADGNIELLGRRDRQVKIRGMRIEPEEIEAVLVRHLAVGEAAVIKKEISSKNDILVAFIKESGQDRALPEGLKEYLSVELPEYMIPSRIIRVEDFPRKPNGKIDYHGLGLLFDELGREQVPPRNEVEEKLRTIWSDILQNERIGVTDNFFEVGGNSLNLMTLITRIQRQFDTTLTLAEAFKYNAIEGQARVVSARLKQDTFIPIRPVEKRDCYPLSSAQSRLYILQKMEPESSSYNLPQSIPLPEEPDRRRLSGVIEGLAKRHESLRTSFRMVNGGVVQVVHDRLDFEIDWYDTAEYRSSAAVDEVVKNFVRPFDLSRPPLFRVGVITGGKGLCHLLVDLHHIAADGLSLDILEQDFFALYRGGHLPSLPLQYKDYCRWQNRPEYRETLKGQQDFWVRAFSDEIPVLALPTDFARPTVQSFEGDIFRFGLDEAVVKGLRSLSARQDVTMYMLLLTAYYILLSRLSDQEDIVVGTPVAGRRHADLEHIIGMFVNTLPLRNYVDPGSPFLSFLQEVKQKTLKALDNQEYPFEDLVERVQVRRDTGRNPIFDVLFTYHRFDLAGTAAIPASGEHGRQNLHRTAKFDLSLTVSETEDMLALTLEYSTRLFTAATIERFSRGYRHILDAITTAPDQGLVGIDMVPEAERCRIVEDFNNTGSDYPRQAAVQQLFAHQARHSPDSAVVSYRDIQLSYDCLDEIAGQLAGLLVREGTGRGDIVGIMTHHCPEMVIGILAILKAGGAYLPVNPDYPPDRKRYMLKDSGSRLLLTTLTAADDCGARAIPLLEWFPHRSGEGVQVDGDAEDLVYVTYTSGSTGKPKGVVVEHRGVVRLVKKTNYFTFRPKDRWLQTSALAFDVSTFEIWGPLLNGGHLCLVDKDVILDAGQLKRTLRRRDVTIMWMSSPLFNHMLEADEEIFTGLRCLVVGGDILSPSRINQARQRFPALKIINGYGPTENSTFSTAFLVDREYTRSIPIGRPLANSTAYIVDKYERLQPIGVIGELYLGGDGVVRGYLNAPELTAERFPLYALQPGAAPCRVYRSGDLGRWMPDGNIEFFGRADSQIKIRGFRVELGEIESQLLQHPHIRQAVVLAGRDQRGEKSLRAYVVMAEAVTAVDLKAFLSVRLPDYMIPSHFVKLDRMPLTPGRKIDVSRLNEGGTELVRWEEYVEPQDDIERRIAEIWQEILEVDRVGIYDNFFEIGGNSLKLVLLNDRLKETLKQEISVTTLFRYPTIGSLAKYLNHHQETDHVTPQVRRSDSFRQDRKSKIRKLQTRKGAVRDRTKSRV